MADLTTLEATKAYLGLDVSDSDADEILGALIASSSAWFERETRRTFAKQTVNEVRGGNGTDTLYLRREPVVSVASVKMDGEVLPKQIAATDDGWRFADDRIYQRGRLFRRGAVIEVEYVAGYETVPADVAQAVTVYAALQFREKDRLGQAMIVAGGQTVETRFTGGSPAFAYVRSVVDAYRRIPV